MPRTVSPEKRLPKNLQTCVIYLKAGGKTLAVFYAEDFVDPEPAWSDGQTRYSWKEVKGWHNAVE